MSDKIVNLRGWRQTRRRPAPEDKWSEAEKEAFAREGELRGEILSLVAKLVERKTEIKELNQNAALNALIGALAVVANVEEVSGLSVVKVLCHDLRTYFGGDEKFAEFFFKGLPREWMEQDWYGYYELVEQT